MKIQLDTTSKIIKIEESVNLNDFFELLNRILPNDIWKEYKLEVNIIQNWTNPIVIPSTPIYPAYPWWQSPIITYCTSVADGTFNIDVQ